MNKYIIILAILIIPNLSLASEVTGVISTGLSGTVNETLTGTVTETVRRGGGGGGGGSTPPAAVPLPIAVPPSPLIPILTDNSVTTAHNFLTDLSVGSQGFDVSELQTRLTNLGIYMGPITGTFGPLTLAAVKIYQENNNLPPTGYVGPMTRDALNKGSSPTISQFIELLIRLGVISSDKADGARKAIGL